jgi:heptosyltransferase-2
MGTEATSVAILQPAFLGDLLLTVPSLFQIKKTFPKVETVLIGRKTWEPLLKIFPCVERPMGIDKRQYKNPLYWRKLRRDIAADVFINAHRSYSSQLFGLATTAHTKLCFETTFLSRFYSRHLPYGVEPEWKRVYQLAQAAFPLPDAAGRWDVPIPVTFSKADEAWFRELRLPSQYTVIAPGSRWPTKRWPLASFETLARELAAKSPVVWTGVASEVEGVPRVDVPAVNLIGRTTLTQWYMVLSRAELIVCNDSAASHVGMLSQVPTCAVFGSTIPAFGYAPGQTASAVVETMVECRPCSSHGRESCPKQHFRCMTDIDPKSVLQTCQRLLQAAS